MTLNNSTVSGNDAGGCARGGGGIDNHSGTLILNNSTVSGNTATCYAGGGIVNFVGTATLNNSTVSGNTAANRGGGISNGFNWSGTLTLNNSTVSGNTAASAGGGIFLERSDTVSVTNSTVSGNTAASAGGGIFLERSDTVSVTNSTVSGNTAASAGGGIFLERSDTVSVTNSTVSGNTAASAGGGIFLERSDTVSVTNSTVSGNTAASAGGGIFLERSDTVSVTNSTVSGNTAASAGGGIFLERSDTVSVTNSTVSGNTAASAGGGIFLERSDTVSVTNSTVSGNTAPDFGGISSKGGNTLTLSNSTVSGNSATNSYGGIYNPISGTADLRNTIIAGNSAGSGSPDCGGTLTSQGYNLVQDTSGCTIAGDLTGNITGLDPILGPLQDNGGPTETHALLLASPVDSPAIDAIPVADCVDTSGNPVTADQRGVSRPQGTACDIGAYELGAGPPDQPPLVSITSPTEGSEVVEGTTITFDADATDDVGVAKVDFFANDVLASTDLTEPYSADIQVPTEILSLTLKATASDTAGQTASDTVTVNVISPPEPPQDQTMYVYSVKIMCVPHLGPASPALMPGKYRTAVNVHNPWDQPALIEKWVTLSNPQGIPPITGDRIHETLQSWSAFDVDCPHMRDQFGLPKDAQVPGGKGFMVIRSDRELDIVAVYTSRTETPNKNGMGISIDVETIEPKLVTTTFEELVTSQVAHALKDDVLQFHLVDLDVPKLAQELELGTATLPVADGVGNIHLDIAHSAARVQLRDFELTKGTFKSEIALMPIKTELVLLPLEQNWRLGGCATLGPTSTEPTCGAVTILNAAKTMVSGVVLDQRVGMSYVEPARHVLGIVGDWDGDGLHVIYNHEHTVPPVFSTGISGPESPTLAGAVARQVPGLASPFPRPVADTLRQTKVVLDGDRQFYNIDPSTVWSRMEAVHNIVSVIYELIEPFSTNGWALHIPVKGMEVWIAGGPSTTDNQDLLDEIVEPGYFLIHPPDNNELHILFVGYNVSGAYGWAAGIGSAAGGIGGGPGLNHVYSEARSSQSLKTKWVVLAHEWGHLIGGRHGDGTTVECTGGFLDFLCGPSLMLPGSAGAPDTRGPYFSDANDANIIAVIDSLPSWP